MSCISLLAIYIFATNCFYVCFCNYFIILAYMLHVTRCIHLTFDLTIITIQFNSIYFNLFENAVDDNFHICNSNPSFYSFLRKGKIEGTEGSGDFGSGFHRYRCTKAIQTDEGTIW